MKSIQSGQAAQFMVEYQAQPGVEPDRLGIRIKVTDSNNTKYFYLATDLASVAWDTLPERGRLVCALPEIPLAPGRYLYHLVCERGKEMFDDVAHAGSFQVIGGDFFGTGQVPKAKWGPVLVRHAWRLEGSPAPASR
jgi:lipopolysaccharide transport system ATP-binding protein